MGAVSFLLLLAQATAQPGGAPPDLAPATPSPARQAPAGTADAVARWRPHMREASPRFGVPVAWIERVMRAESGGRTHLDGRPITSRAGAMGLMQVMPATWSELRAILGLGRDPHDPRDNILAGTFYLRRMYDRFGYPGLFGAYNAGPGRYAEWLAGRRMLPAETRAYLAAVAGAAVDDARSVEPAEAPPPLFAIRYDGRRTGPPSIPRHSSLFVITSAQSPTLPQD